MALSFDDTLAGAVDKIVSDPQTREAFNKKPIPTLKSLGVEFDDEKQARQIAKGLKDGLSAKPASAELAAWTRPLVRVATKGTQPAVSVAVNVATGAKMKK